MCEILIKLVDKEGNHEIIGKKEINMSLYVLEGKVEEVVFYADSKIEGTSVQLRWSVDQQLKSVYSVLS